MEYSEKNIDKVISSVRWPAPSHNLKNKILRACDEEKKYSFCEAANVNRKSCALFLTILIVCFVLGAFVGNYKNKDTDITLSETYLYTDAGTVLASNLLY